MALRLRLKHFFQNVIARFFGASHMSKASGTSEPKLPPGETDPNQLYIAVGRAIHAWENMEEALARLFSLLTGLPETPHALSDYGADNRRFIDRHTALRAAATEYFVLFPGQQHEGEVASILQTALELSIKRHRVAHGVVTQWGEFQLPDTLASGEEFEVKSTFLYRWGAPWYSRITLRTDPVGGNAASIEGVQKEFEALHTRIFNITFELPRRS